MSERETEDEERKKKRETVQEKRERVFFWFVLVNAPKFPLSSPPASYFIFISFIYQSMFFVVVAKMLHARSCARENGWGIG